MQFIHFEPANIIIIDIIRWNCDLMAVSTILCYVSNLYRLIRSFENYIIICIYRGNRIWKVPKILFAALPGTALRFQWFNLKASGDDGQLIPSYD